MSDRYPSPLRYPGGKTSIADVLESVIEMNGLDGCTFIEAFAGGAGAALKLLRRGVVDRIVINDRDRSVFCFWKCVMTQTQALVDRIENVPLDIDEWRRQREIYLSPGRCKHLDLGFAAFYLNRCNRSGIIKNGGPIGGIDQSGRWKIDARFNREALSARIVEIAEYGDRIVVSNEDAAALLDTAADRFRSPIFIYADPPYYDKGRELYLNFYEDADHVDLAKQMAGLDSASWVMTYDNVPRIRELYAGNQLLEFSQRYSAHQSSRNGDELLIAPPRIRLPKRQLRQLARAS
ncbi:DNA adenine methylase [Opitutales bacterium ASA1]|uniref:DNA adenine methylase n=1 Tax=Congregicoccus parvus TaxID=3081749 RepID=UPI002B29E96E|nr:DNA adenine methylase [Opitutales bacterium ASA1]